MLRIEVHPYDLEVVGLIKQIFRNGMTEQEVQEKNRAQKENSEKYRKEAEKEYKEEQNKQREKIIGLLTT